MVTSFLRDIRGIIDITNHRLYKIISMIPGTRSTTVVVIRGDVDNSPAIILKVEGQSKHGVKLNTGTEQPHPLRFRS
jgi:hypothetical protein